MTDKSLILSDLPDYVTYGRYVSIALGCTFLPLECQHRVAINHKCVYTTNYNQSGNDGNHITIGHDVWVGTEVKFIAPLTIGNGAIIGAYSVIAKDVPPYAVVVGNPQVIKRYRFTKKQIKALKKIKWYEWEEEVVRDRLPYMDDIDLFIKKYSIDLH